MKKFILIASTVIFATLLIGGALFLFRKARVAQEGQRVVAQQKVQEEKMKNPLQLVTSQNARAFWFFKDAIFGISDEGRLFSTDNAGAPESGTNAPQPVFETLQGVYPSQDGSRVLVLNGNAADSSEIYVYNTPDHAWKRISGRALAVALSPDGKRLARIRETFGVGATIDIAELDGSAGYSIASVAPLDASLAWITNNLIELKTVPSQAALGYSLFIDIDTKRITPLALEKGGLMTLWSSSRNRGLAYWIDTDGKQKSAFIDRGGAILRYTSSPFIPVKCAFANDIQLVCGAFRKNAPISEIGLPDEYLMGAVSTEDQIVSIDVQTGLATTLLASSEIALDVFMPSIHSKKFYFINRYGGIYSFAF